MVDPIPEGVRRFVLTSIPTVPHLETLLLLWREPGEGWLPEDVARRLYIPVASAQVIVEELGQADLLVSSGDPKRYQARREPPSLQALFVDLDQAYARQLRAVTALIHSHVDRKASRFADAFSLRKEKD